MRKMNARTNSMNIIEGELERITYFNEQTHYTIAHLKTAVAVTPVTIIGFLGGIQPGETLKVSGSWETHPKFGQQFRVKNCEVTLPATIQGIKKYLQSGAVKGIGSRLADRLIKHFGDKTLEIIEKHPEKLTEAEGIGKNKALLITEAWNEHHVLRGLLNFLQDMGIKTTYGAKIFHLYGRQALQILQETPYRLAEDIPYAGFQMADTIAKKLGTQNDNPVRIIACIFHALELYANEGHTFALKNHLAIRCEHLFKIPQDAVHKQIESLSESGEVFVEKINLDKDEVRNFEFCDDTPEFSDTSFSDTSMVYRKSLYVAENSVASRMVALVSIPVEPAQRDADFIHKQIHHELGIELSPAQSAILKDIFSRKAAIISGGPGTGKTTLIRAIAAAFKAMNQKVILGAPTGRAARKLSEVSGEKAFTIHRLLGFTYSPENSGQSYFGRDQDNPLEAHVIIIDEASMIDTILMYHLLNAVPLTSRLILVGDIFQLPSVGPGNVLSDLIESDIIQVYYLNEIFRQAQKSTIIINAHKVLKGEFPDVDTCMDNQGLTDFYFLEQHDPKKVADTIVSLCCEILPKQYSLDPFSDIQVISPMHKGDAGTINLNGLLQKKMNRSTTQAEVLGNTFKFGDKVMHLKNNYQKDVFNGDIGIICSMNINQKIFSVNYDGRIVEYDHAETDELTLAYAISVHKSQGSEYPAVILPMTTQHYMLLQRNLLYTAITRGIKLVVIVGTQKAMNIAIRNNKPRRRLSGLSFRIKRNI